MNTEGRKNDAGKRRWHLVPWDALEEVVRALEHGAVEYGEENWRNVKGWRWRYFNAAMRHLTAWFYRGEIRDPDSGIHHVACAVACGLFIIAKDLEPSSTAKIMDEVSAKLRAHVDAARKEHEPRERSIEHHLAEQEKKRLDEAKAKAIAEMSAEKRAQEIGDHEAKLLREQLTGCVDKETLDRMIASRYKLARETVRAQDAHEALQAAHRAHEAARDRASDKAKVEASQRTRFEHEDVGAWERTRTGRA